MVVCVCEVMCPPGQSMEVLLIRDALLASVVAYIARDTAHGTTLRGKF